MGAGMPDQAAMGWLLFILGVCCGSFFNVVIWRLPRGGSLLRPPSACPHCGRRIRRRDLVPVISWLLLKGRCRDCGGAIAARYPLLEALTGALFVAVYAVTGWGAELPAGLVLVSFLVVVAAIDIDHQLILDKVVIAFALAGVAAGLATGRPGWAEAAFGLLLAGGLLLALVLLTGAMGWGDANFAAAAGLWLGWQGALVMLFTAFLGGGLIGGLLLLSGRYSRKDPLPFGPFLCIGTAVAWFWGRAIIAWYWSLAGL